MMNKRRTKEIGRTKYIMFLPLAALLMIVSNIEVVARTTERFAKEVMEQVNTPQPEIANISEIPSLFITDMYPLSMHAVAIYGKILGEPANYLITQLIPDSNGESEETTTYTYTLDNRGIVTSCHAVVRHIRNGYEQDYTRTVNYTIE